MRTFGRIYFNNKREEWEIEALEPHVSIRIKHLFPSIPKTSVPPYYIRNTPDLCADILWFMDRYPLDITDVDRNRLDTGKNNYLIDVARGEELLLPDYVPSKVSLREGHSARRYQLVGKDFLSHFIRFLLADDIGLGKTLTAILGFFIPDTLPAAVVVQTHLNKQWEKEIKEYTKGIKVHVIKRSTAYNLPPADVYIFKYGSVKGWVELFAEGFFKYAIFDEIQEVRRAESEKHGACNVLGNYVNYAIGLSATPIYNYGGEIYNIFQVLKPGALGSFDDFVREWCTYLGNGKYALRDPKAFGMYLRESNLMLRRTRKDVGRELPPVNKIVVDVDYDEDKVVEVETLARQLALTVTTSESYHERGEAAREFNSLMRMSTGLAKAKHVAAYCKLILEADEPLVIGIWHRKVYDVFMNELKEFNPVMYSGSETVVQKQKAYDDFVEGRSMCFLISLHSGAGLNGLHKRSKYVVHAELDWSPKVHDQLTGRLDRDGILEGITSIFPVTSFGSDPFIMSVLGLKRDQSDGIESPNKGLELLNSDISRVKDMAADFLKKQGKLL